MSSGVVEEIQRIIGLGGGADDVPRAVVAELPLEPGRRSGARYPPRGRPDHRAATAA